MKINEIDILEYGKFISAICKRAIQDINLAEDVAQEIWIEIIKSLDNYKGDSKLSTWIYTISYRTIYKHIRREKTYTTKYLSEYFNQDKLDVPDDIDYEHNIWIKEMCDKCLTGVLHCLDNDSRLIYLFRDIAQLDYNEIAKITNKKEDTIRKNVSRARAKLKNFLNNECVLYNPNGTCNCRMKDLVTGIELEKEYDKLREIAKQTKFFLNSEMILPNKNYWERYL